MTIYNDSIHGCKEFIAVETRYVLTKDSKFEADDFLNGCWCVRNVDLYCESGILRGDVIIYMAGYKDMFGVMREDNDFEFGNDVIR